MTNFSKVAATLLLAAIFATACKTVVDNELGIELMPDNQKMTLRHLTFKGGNVIRFDNEAWETNKEISYIETPAPNGSFFETRLYRTDSLRSSNLGRGFIGIERSDTFGIRTAGFASTMMYMNAVNDSVGFGYKPIFDTMKLLMTVDNYGRDTLTPVKYTIFEIKTPIVGSLIEIPSEGDTIAANISCDLTKIYDENKPLFTFTYPDGEKIGPTTTNFVLTPVDMSETGATWDFVRRLMLIPEASKRGADWDGYARDNDSLYVKEEKFAEAFNGIVIVPDKSSMVDGKQGSLYSLNLEQSGLLLQGRSRNPLDPTLIKDTIGMMYYFVDTYSRFDKNVSASSVEYDYTKGTTDAAPLLASYNISSWDATGKMIDKEQRTKVETCYVEGMGGVVTELTFTDDFLDCLAATFSPDREKDGYQTIGINQCQMAIYLPEASYDWQQTQSKASVLYPLMDASLTRLGMYMYYDRFTNIADYDYYSEQKYSTEIPYKGELNRSRACYVMNITTYMQTLINHITSEEFGGKDEAGHYRFETLEAAMSDEALTYKVNHEAEYNTRYVQPTVYIGPEATSPYTFNRSLFQGADGGTNEAPIHIDLTYTLVKNEYKK